MRSLKAANSDLLKKARFALGVALIAAGGSYLLLASSIVGERSQSRGSAASARVDKQESVSGSRSSAEGPAVTRLSVSGSKDVRAEPRSSGMQLRIPSLSIAAPVLSVGLTNSDHMEAPSGSWSDPIWRKTFWYRGGSTPGDPGVATIAGHVSGGMNPVFERLPDLKPGARIEIADRFGESIAFEVISTEIVPASINDVAKLERIFGEKAVSSSLNRAPPADDISRLTLITCYGDLVDGSYGRRLIIYSRRL